MDIRKGFEFDKGFRPATPSLVLTATVGSVTVVTKLYGDVSPARYEKEKAEIEHRARQLTPIEKRERKERIFKSRMDRMMEDAAEFDRPRIGRRKMSRREHE